jgi:hypothetical protein
MALPGLIYEVGDTEAALKRHWGVVEFLATASPEIRKAAWAPFGDVGRAEDTARQTHTGRYPIELLQNAHDACEDARTVGTAIFQVTRRAVLVANEGIPFTADRINSLTRVGSSEKARRRGASRLIGYKGVGFTSVFELTDRPQVISSTARFLFDRVEARRRVGQLLGEPDAEEVIAARNFPFELPDEAWAEDRDLVEGLLAGGAVTVIRLPFSTGRSPKAVEEEIAASLVPEVLLFMPAIDRLEIRSPTGVRSWRRQTSTRVGRAQVLVLVSESRERRSWLVRVGTATLRKAEAEALKDPLWKDVRQLNVAVALPWDRGRPRAAGPQPVFAYFPTVDRLGRSLLIHGDFYLDPSRRNVETRAEHGVVTGKVSARAVELAVGLATSLAKHGRPLLDCLAPTEPGNGFGQQLGVMLDAALADARIVRPAVGEKCRRPRDLQSIPGQLSPSDEERLVAMMTTADDLVRPGDDRNGAGDWIEQLGTQNADAAALAGRIDGRRTKLPYGAVLALLESWARTAAEPWEINATLRRQTVVQDTDRVWRRPADVMRPVDGTPHLPPPLARTELLVPSYGPARDFIQRLGIEPLTPSRAFEIVLGAIKGGRFGRTDGERQQALRYADLIWRIDQEIVRSARAGHVTVPVKQAQGRKIAGWRAAGMTYFPANWAGNDLLDHLYGPLKQPEFLGEAPPAAPSSKADRFAFYQALGVRASPRLVDISDELKGYYDWVRSPDVAMAWVCPEGRHITSERSIVGTVIDRLDDVVERVATNARLAKSFARTLAGLPDPYGPRAEIRCGGATHGGQAPLQSATGYQRWLLESRAWVPVTHDPHDEALVHPSLAWTGQFRQADYVLVPRADLRLEEGAKLGLIPQELPPAGAVEKALLRLSQARPQPAGDKPALDSALWLMRKLDRATQRATHPTEAPPLLAMSEAGLVWTTLPAVANVPGMPAIPGLATLPAGRWQGLRRAYGLSLTSALVEGRLLPGKRRLAGELLSLPRRIQLLAVLLRRDVPESETASRLAGIREDSRAWLTVEWRLIGAETVVVATPDFYLEVRRNKRDAAIGAFLFRDANYQPEPMTLGQAIAEYLQLVDEESEVELFMNSPDDLVKLRAITQNELNEAEQLLRGRRYFQQSQTREPPASRQPGSGTGSAAGGPGLGVGPAGENGAEPPGTTMSGAESETGTVGDKSGQSQQTRRHERSLLDPDAVAFGARRKPPPSSEKKRPDKRQGHKAKGDQRPPRKKPQVFDWVRPDDEVEERAMRIATRYGYEQAGAAKVIDVHTQNLGWDIEFHFEDRTWQPVEVKGSSGAGYFVITPNEWRAAQEHRNYLLIQVANIGSPAKGEARIYRDLGELLDEELMAGMSWAVTGWTTLDPEIIDLDLVAT